MQICSIDGCDREVSCRGWCVMHYKRWRRHGDPTEIAVRRSRWPSLSERLWAKVNKTDTCWLWTGLTNHGGYGVIGTGQSYRLTHRLTYELLVGPIPEGLTLDHLCRTPPCVNPAHLEPVTPGENALRGTGPTAIHARKTHCKHGHEFTPENTRRYVDRKGRPSRRCIICERRRNNESAARRRARDAA